jgi:phenylpropionate dioxygenase-like ring-hydroxylating dioxygenase large terminal subunit/AcrR family transcriptional regulator
MNQQSSFQFQDHRKKQLIDATLCVISENGLANTTIAKVTKLAGLSTGIVNYYFESRENLLIDTLAYIALEYEAALNAVFESAKAPIDIIKEFVHVSFLPPIFIYEKVVVWHSFCANPKTRKIYYDTVGEIETRILNKVAIQINRIILQNNLTYCNKDSMALALINLVDYHSYKFSEHKMDFDLIEAENNCLDLVTALFGSLLDQKHSTVSSMIRLSEKNAEGDNLPPWTYTNEEYFKVEQQQLFRKNWMVAGHANDIPNIGDYILFDAAGIPTIIMHGDDGQLRILENSCQHQGSRLLECDKGHCDSTLICPFHEWAYGLDGQLVEVPDLAAFHNLEKGQIRLREFELEAWNGFIFVRIQPGDQSVEEQLSPVNHLFAPYNLEEVYPLDENCSKDIAAFNWKIIQEVEYDLDQIPAKHSSLLQMTGKSGVYSLIDRIPVWSGKVCSSLYSDNRSIGIYQSLLPEFPHLPKEFQRAWHHITVFPYLSFALHPDCVRYTMTQPISTSTTQVINRCYGLQDDRKEVRTTRYLSERVQKQFGREKENSHLRQQQGLQARDHFDTDKTQSSSRAGILYANIRNQLPVAGLKQEPPHGTIADTNRQLLSKKL